MLVPLALADSQYISRGFENWRVGLFVCGICHHEQNIDYRFGNEAGDGSRTNVLDSKGAISQQSADTLSFTSKLPWPFRIVVHQLYRPVEHGGFTYSDTPQVLFGMRLRRNFLRVSHPAT